MNILIVDDSQDNLDLMSIYFKSSEHKIVYEIDPVNVTKQLKEQSFDLVFLDISMPVMSGFEVLEQIKSEFPDTKTKICALTAKSMESDIEEIKNAGFDLYLSKPILKKDILEFVERNK